MGVDMPKVGDRVMVRPWWDPNEPAWVQVEVLHTTKWGIIAKSVDGGQHPRVCGLDEWRAAVAPEGAIAPRETPREEEWVEWARALVGRFGVEVSDAELRGEIEHRLGRLLPEVALIDAERRRQINEEGYSSEHDDEYEAGHLAVAAACYAYPPWLTEQAGLLNAKGQPRFWPWAPEWWKPSPDDRIRDLVKSGALIASEIGRLLRAGGLR